MTPSGSNPHGQAFDLATAPLHSETVIVEASAGTGKTYTLTALVLRLLLEKKLETRQILVVTFTNAATEELSGRIRQALRETHSLLTGAAPAKDPFQRSLVDRFADQEGAELLRRALLDFDELTVATIHGFCKRALEESAFESGLPFEVDFLDNDEHLLVDTARDVWRRLTDTEDLRGPLFAMWAAERSLSPAGFVAEYRRWRRHPRTEILPRPQPLDVALAAVRNARADLNGAFDRVRLRLALTRLKLHQGSELGSPERLKAVLAAAERFCRAGDDGLWALALLRLDALAKAVPEDKIRDLQRLPALAEIDALFAAFERFEHAVRCRFLDELALRFNQVKEKRGCLAFDDLLHRLHGSLRHPDHGARLRVAVRRRFRAALIDEFQDTDLIQYEIFKGLFQGLPLVLVGDPKQAIYGFRGADIFAYLLARKDARRIYTLSRNWRSGQDLVEAVNGLFGESPHPFVFDEIPFRPVVSAPAAADRELTGDFGKALTWMWLPRSESRANAESLICRHVAQEIVRLLSSGLELTSTGVEARPLRPGDIAVLVRTNAQAVATQGALREVGVPSVVGRSGDIFQSPEMEELLRLLDAVIDPARGERLRAACATIAWGDDAGEIYRLQRDDRAYQRLVDLFDGYRQTWQERGFIAMMGRLLDEVDVAQRLLSLDGGERRLTNLQHSVEVLHQGIHDRGLGPAALVAWARAEAEAREHDRDAAELRLESDSLAVSIVTVHKSKGLEYEVVFCPFLWQAQSVDRPPVVAHFGPDRVIYDCGSERLAEHTALAEAERLAEDLRLTYVALTRAKRRCIVAWGDIGRGGASSRSALAYLLHRRQAALPVSTVDESGGGPQAVAERVAAELDSIRERRSDWAGDLKELVARHSQSMDLREIDEDIELQVWRPAADENQALQALEFPVEAWGRLTPWRISSFSSLVRDGARELPDHGDPELPEPDRRSRDRPDGIFAFARGPRAGDCLHQIFEGLDFTDRRAEATREVVRRELERFRLSRPEDHGLPHDGWSPMEATVEMIGRVLSEPLPTAGFQLAEIENRRRLVEWQFYAPLNGVTPVEISDLWFAHARASWAQEYGARLQTLGPSQLNGFLTGYVDLLFEHQGRWYIVDWKSNHLGNQAADYGMPAMTRAMVEHHYVLQYHLYTVAAHRYLSSRLRDWDYERDFGGVYYLFLRGVGSAPEDRELRRESDLKPATPPTIEPAPPSAPKPMGQLSLFGPEPELADQAPLEQPISGAEPASVATPDVSVQKGPFGVFHDKPPRSLILSLDRLLGTGSPEA